VGLAGRTHLRWVSNPPLPMGLFQVTRCAQNHHPREQPAPAPKSGPTAIALLLLSLCTPADAPAHTPGRTISSTPGPFAPRCPKKVPPSRVTRSRPCPIQPHAGTVSSQCLRHFSPRIRPNPAISPPSIAICAHACYHLSREGPTPRLGSPTPNRALGPGIRRGIPCGCPGDSEGTAGRPRSAPCPLLPRGATFMLRIAQASITELRSTGDTLNYETHRMSQKLTDFAFPHSLGQRRWGAW